MMKRTAPGSEVFVVYSVTESKKNGKSASEVKILGCCKNEQDAEDFVCESKQEYILDIIDAHFVTVKAAALTRAPHKQSLEINDNNVAFVLFAKCYLTWTYTAQLEDSQFHYVFNDKTIAKMDKDNYFVQKLYDMCKEMTKSIESNKIYYERTFVYEYEVAQKKQ